MSDKQQLFTPFGTLRWVYINGNPTRDLSGREKYSANLVVPRKEGEEFARKLMDFWNANKPKSAPKRPKSMGVYRIFTYEDEDGTVRRKTLALTRSPEDLPEGAVEDKDHLEISAWTSTTMPSGSPKEVPVYNAAGKRVHMPRGTRIGNGSRGRLAVTASIYNTSGNVGIALYLDGIQVTHYESYSGPDVSFEATDGDFTDTELAAPTEDPALAEATAPHQADYSDRDDSEDIPF